MSADVSQGAEAHQAEKLQECYKETHGSQRPSKHATQAPPPVVYNNLISTCQKLVSSGCWIPGLAVITHLFSSH